MYLWDLLIFREVVSVNVIKQLAIDGCEMNVTLFSANGVFNYHHPTCDKRRKWTPIWSAECTSGCLHTLVTLQQAGYIEMCYRHSFSGFIFRFIPPVRRDNWDRKVKIILDNIWMWDDRTSSGFFWTWQWNFSFLPRRGISPLPSPLPPAERLCRTLPPQGTLEKYRLWKSLLYKFLSTLTVVFFHLVLKTVVVFRSHVVDGELRDVAFLVFYLEPEQAGFEISKNELKHSFCIVR